MCGALNITNITDGLDRLLSMPVIFIAITLSIITIAIINGYNHYNIEYDLLYNILLILITIIATFSTFLVFNCYPVEIIMKDVGSLMIDIVLCYISILLKVEILFGIMSLLFVEEIFSTTLQATCLLLTKDQKKNF